MPTELAGTREVAADPAAVWAALIDPEVLKACIPGCQSMTGTPETGFEAVVMRKVGPVSAQFAGRITLSDIVPGRSVRLTGEGRGGAAGFARGSARVVLTPSATGTSVGYEIEADVGGKLAQLGSRIVDGFARRMADEFFARFQQVIEAPDGARDPAAQPDAPKPGGWLKRLIG